jgi:hypothetical protein
MRPEVRVLYHPPASLPFSPPVEVSQMQRARDLIKPYLAKEGVVGIYVVGSATRPFRDELSDYDIEVIVTDDVYDELPDDQKHVFVIEEGPPRRVDHEFYLRPWSELTGMFSSTRDLSHYPYQHAVVLHDPSGDLTDVVKRLAELPHSIRRARIRVHFLEFITSLRRASKESKRKAGFDLQLIYCEALIALTKVLFLVMGSWPAGRHWSREELFILGIDSSFVDMISDVFSSPTGRNMARLETEVRKWLVDKGELLNDCGDEAFGNAYKRLVSWAYLTPEGKKAFEHWASR